MSVHRINLRGPWDYAWQEPNAGHHSVAFAISGTVSMPQEWRSLFGDVGGCARFQRKFHRPTNLEPHERVFIVLTEARGTGSVKLNETPLGEFTANATEHKFDVTKALEPFNVLTVELTHCPSEAPDQSGGLYGVVAIEIRNES